MKLEDIGFYTLSDKRAKEVTWSSDLQRCELILTDRCNFNCAYCRGIKKELRGDISLDQAKEVIDIWVSNNVANIRLSGGEPTLWLDLLKLVRYIKSQKCIEHIALSTNGSASIDYYLQLQKAGVNDFSISFDACCSMEADMMAGTTANFEHICEAIKVLSKVTYVTAGIVLDERNNSDVIKIIDLATKLGVGDIRIIPSAQSNQKIDLEVETKYPILQYRLNNLKSGKPVRGLSLSEHNCRKCHLVKDDMAVLHGEHFPCIIYMREQGDCIGSVYGSDIEKIRTERREWFEKTDTFLDSICRKNCLDVCRDHNDKVDAYIIREEGLE